MNLSMAMAARNIADAFDVTYDENDINRHITVPKMILGTNCTNWIDVFTKEQINSKLAIVITK